MITCKECIEQNGNHDPRIRSGAYNKCSCDYCNKPTYFRELEQAKQEREEMFSLKYFPTNEFYQVKAELNFLHNKLNEHIDASKKAKSRGSAF